MLLGRAFHSSGAATANDLFLKVLDFVCGITSPDVVQILVPDALFDVSQSSVVGILGLYHGNSYV